MFSAQATSLTRVHDIKSPPVKQQMGGDHIIQLCKLNCALSLIELRREKSGQTTVKTGRPTVMKFICLLTSIFCFFRERLTEPHKGAESEFISLNDRLVPLY